MRILFCCEFYAPSVGGAQEVVRQVSERLVERGHEVTVATTKLTERTDRTINGVRVEEFAISGNAARGFEGEVNRYQRFLLRNGFDVMMNYAAQQWATDLAFPLLERLSCLKVLNPCGFSGLYEPSYVQYFRQIPKFLRQYDHLIFCGSSYRDISFSRAQGLEKLSIVPNGASEGEFNQGRDPDFRKRHSVSSEDLLFLTVGNLVESKGHLEVTNAFYAADFDGKPATLILNGNECRYSEQRSALKIMRDKIAGYYRAVQDIHDARGSRAACAHMLHGIINKLCMRIGAYAAARRTFLDDLHTVIEKIHRQGSRKRVLMTDLPRPELVQAYMNADLFVLASHIECSPLVLFESAAAGTPFLSVPVGNAEEIACWTGAGVICPAPQDERGYTVPQSGVLAEYMSRLTKDRGRLRLLGIAGKKKWSERFTWGCITDQYERLFSNICRKHHVET
ncbi:MAG: glycosyltransferase family 4 protein [Nitrospira sp.]|nr:glycosyltransferase family 4 protein [Nitrospira sp.]